MKLYEGKFKSYTIDELSDGAKQKAFEKWSTYSDYPWASEVRDTLDEFCRLFDVNCYDWSYDFHNYDYRFEIQNDDISELSDIRLATYIWNNYAKYITKGKCYSLWSTNEKSERNPNMGKLKKRHSKVMTSMDDCPLTGVCFDCDILEPIINCLMYRETYDSYEELIESCLNRFFAYIVKDVEWCGSIECFNDFADANECEYDEYGNEFELPTGFEETA